MSDNNPFTLAAQQGQEQIDAMKAHYDMGYEQGVKSERDKSKNIKVNINHMIRFKLSDVGQKILDDYDETIRALSTRKFADFSAGKFDEKGFCVMELWQAFGIFGPHCINSALSPFEDCEIIISIE